jgi:hypothetical protein
VGLVTTSSNNQRAFFALRNTPFIRRTATAATPLSLVARPAMNASVREDPAWRRHAGLEREFDLRRGLNRPGLGSLRP